MALFEFKSNRGKIDAELDAAIHNALELVGQVAEGDVAMNAPVGDTSQLRQTIAHKVDDTEDAVYVGSTMEYAPYVEYGTGIYAEKGGRQSGWWVYAEGKSSGKKGHKSYTYEEAKQIVARMRAQGIDAHMTQGRKATHFMRDAIQKNQSTYAEVIARSLKSDMN